MYNIASIYPATPGARFDFDYYLTTHMPRSIELLSAAKGFRGVSVERGIDLAEPPIASSYLAMCHYYFDTVADFVAAFTPHAEELQRDICNYTDVVPTIQISRICLRR